MICCARGHFLVIFALKGTSSECTFEKRSVNSSNRVEDVLHGESGWRTEAAAAAAVWLMKQLSHQDIFICWQRNGLSSWQIAFGPYVTWKLQLTHALLDRDIHTNTLKQRAKTLNRLAFWFLAGSAILRLQTFDDKWPSTHLKWKSSQRIVVIDSFFTKRLNRKKFPPDRTADQTKPPAKDIRSHRHNCHCLRWLIHEQYVVWAAGPCCRSEIEQRGTAHW